MIALQRKMLTLGIDRYVDFYWRKQSNVQFALYFVKLGYTNSNYVLLLRNVYATQPDGIERGGKFLTGHRISMAVPEKEG